jgi:hypothetical protein
VRRSFEPVEPVHDLVELAGDGHLGAQGFELGTSRPARTPWRSSRMATPT